MEKHPLTFENLPAYVFALGEKVDSLLDRLNQPTTSAQVEEFPLTVQQAADLLDVTPATVYDLVHKRRIPSHRPGKRLYFLRSELMDWIRNGRRLTADELTSKASDRVTRPGVTGKKAGKTA